MRDNNQKEIIPKISQESSLSNQQPQDGNASAQLHDNDPFYEPTNMSDTSNDKNKIMTDAKISLAYPNNNDNLENVQMEEMIARIEAFERRTYFQ